MNDTIRYIWFWSGWLSLLLACLIAIWRGGLPERWGAAILFSAWVGSLIADHITGLTHFKAIVFAIDGATLLALGILSGWTRRVWTLFALGFQFIDVMAHAVTLVAPHLGSWAYYTAIQVFGGYGPVLALLGGSLVATRRRQLV